MAPAAPKNYYDATAPAAKGPYRHGALKRLQLVRRRALRAGKSPRGEPPGGKALLGRAARALQAHDLAGAEAALRRAAVAVLRVGRAARGRGSYACAAAYDLALLLSQLGRHDEADRVLGRLGFVHKLHPSIFDGSCGGSSRGAAGQVAAFDGALPPSLLASLRKAFGAASPFWPEHGYPTPNFFSYNVNLAGKEAPLMRAVAECVRPLAEQAFPGLLGAAGDDRMASLEWWAHQRQADSVSGHQLHFDLDEAGLAGLPETAVPPHPLVSCVLYLSGPDEEPGTGFAPTLVTDQGLARGSTAAKAWLCPPVRNRLLLFDGGLLHGVVPQLGRPAAGESEPRVTLMLGFWGSKPAPTLHRAAGSLGPNMPMPRAGSRFAKGPKWPALMAAPAAEAEAWGGARPAALRGAVSPVWLPVPPATVRRPPGGVEFFGRWFLEHEPSRLQELVVAQARRGAAPPEAAVGGGPPALLEVEEVSMEELLRLRALAK